LGLDLFEGEESLEEPFGYKEHPQVVHGKINVEIYWDEKRTDMPREAVNVHLVPFEIFLLPKNQGLCMEGLILQPTYPVSGQCRQLGQFRIKDSWEGNISECNQDISSPLQSLWDH